MVGHGGSSAGSYLTDPTSLIPSHCASIVATSTLKVNMPKFGVQIIIAHQSYEYRTQISFCFRTEFNVTGVDSICLETTLYVQNL